MIPFAFNPLGKSTVRKTGSGTVEDPYLIWNAEDFRVFRNAITAGTTFSGVHHKLMNNIDLTGISFTTSTSSESYLGNFNGNFKIISNFSRSNFGTYSGGLFRRTEGHIRNLGLENVNIDNRNGTANNGNGGITGNNYGIIENCYVTGEIMPQNARTGGIVGYCGTASVVRNCWTNVVISGSGARYAGIVGSMFGIVENCYALGDLVSTNNTYVGGIAGDTNGTFTLRNCVAAMNSVRAGTDKMACRIVGNGATNTLTNNYALNTMLVNGVIPTSNIGGNLPNGLSATITQLKSLAFYRDVMGWDMYNIWQIKEGMDFPKLRGFK